MQSVSQSTCVCRQVTLETGVATVTSMMPVVSVFILCKMVGTTNTYAPRYREQHRDRGDDRHDNQRHDTKRSGNRGKQW